MYEVLFYSIIIIITVLIISIITQCVSFRYFTIKGDLPGPHSVFIGTTHGNEPAGYHALMDFLSKNPKITKGKITIIPELNRCGRLCNFRNNPFGDYDINRNYVPRKIGTPLNQQVINIIKDADWVVDNHEGWGFHNLNQNSVGSGIYPGNTQKAKNLALQLTNTINKTLPNDYHQFSSFNLEAVTGSLRDYCNIKNKHYILIETSGINDIQPLKLRVDQQELLINEIINNLHNK